MLSSGERLEPAELPKVASANSPLLEPLSSSRPGVRQLTVPSKV